jgi:hypothetical protein
MSRHNKKKLNRAYGDTTAHLMSIADQLERIALSWEEYDDDLKGMLDEIWDDIYDVIIYQTIPLSMGLDYNTLQGLIQKLNEKEG